MKENITREELPASRVKNKALDWDFNKMRSLSRAISLVENESEGWQQILRDIPAEAFDIPVIGITGPPGAGKSTLINALITQLTESGKSIGIVAVDPTSPFNYGSLLGDRVRMAGHFNNPQVFIRSLATRGSLGGLSAKTIEVVDVMRSGGFDYILIETVGVGQSEVEIAGLADCTIVVLVPEGGDDVQALKSGVMEIADIFVVNKSDRPGSAMFLQNLKKLLPHRDKYAHQPIPIIPVTATREEGISALIEAIDHQIALQADRPLKNQLLAEKAWQLISAHRMKDLSRIQLLESLRMAAQSPDFSFYRFLGDYLV